MSGKRITTQQVKLYMTHRKRGDSQAAAAAKAGVSERTGRRVETGKHGPQDKAPRHWRTRKDPFVEVWESEVVPWLENEPRLNATTLFEALQDQHPERYPNNRKRTFQRRVKAWKALHGPDKEVMFRQVQEPGRLGLSDFTEITGLTVTIAGAAQPAPGHAAAGARKVSLGTMPDFGYDGPGVRVQKVMDDSPAAAAGVLAGDIVRAIDGEEVADLRSYSNILKSRQPGDAVELKLERDGQELTVRAVLVQR